MAVSIIAAVTTAIVSVITLIIGKTYERRKIIEQQIRNKKIAMYDEFVEMWFRFLRDMTDGKPTPESEMIDFFHSFNRKLLLWGSDEVLAKWSNYRRHFTDNNTTGGPQSLFDFEDLLLTIRKDTGHKNKNIKKGDLLGLFVNDIDQFIK